MKVDLCKVQIKCKLSETYYCECEDIVKKKLNIDKTEYGIRFKKSWFH